MSIHALPPALFLWPILSAGLLVAVGRSATARRALAAVALSVQLGLAIWLAVHTDSVGPIRVPLGGWAPGLGIELVVDRFAAGLVLISVIVLWAVMVFALGQADAPRTSPWYWPVYMALVAGVCLSFMAGDLFNLFVAIEVLLVSSYVLITMDGSNDQIRSGTTYVILNVFDSALLVIAVACTYVVTGTLNFAQIAERMGSVSPAAATGIHLLLLVAFGLKAAVFPLYSWLPDSYPTAPASVSAVFAGLLTKVGVYAMIRTDLTLFGATFRPLLSTLAAATILVGAIGALAQTDMKRILSFHIVSQIGYMVLGLSIGGVAAVAAVAFYMLHHIPTKTSLFLVEGIIESDAGTAELSRLSGLARRSALLVALFALPAASLAGFPPFSGFVAKTGIVEAAIDRRMWIVTGVAIIGSLLTIVSMAKIWSGSFWGEPPEGERMPMRIHPAMAAATGVLVAVTLAITIGAGPLFRWSDRAAVEMMQRPEGG